jgi:magnesium and cobalt transporter
LVTPIHYVPEVINCEQLLGHFRATHTQLAIVVDEFGGMEGLVALENALEEIVGDIAKPGQQPDELEVVQVSDTKYEISAGMSVRYWAETFGIPHLTERVATVAGLMASRLGRPLQSGDVVRVANMEIRVTVMAGRRPRRLEMRLLRASPDEGGAA